MSQGSRPSRMASALNADTSASLPRPSGGDELRATLLAMLGSPHLCSRAFITEQYDRPGRLASYERTRVRRLCQSAKDDWHNAEVWDIVRHDGDPSRHPLGLDPAGLERPCAKCLAKQDDIYAVQPEQPLAENRAQHLHDEAVKRLHHFETYGKYKGRPNFSTVTARGIRVELKDIRAVDPDKAAALERLATDFVSALGTILGEPPEGEEDDDD